MDPQLFQLALIGLGTKVPWHIPPTTLPGGGNYNPAIDEETWNAYRWNPPHMYEAGRFFSTGWHRPRLVTSPVYGANLETVYRESAERPDGAPPGNAQNIEENHVPDGWITTFPVEPPLPVWAMSRYVSSMPLTDYAFQRDPNADPKPTWADLQRGLRLFNILHRTNVCLLYTSPSPRDS